VCGWFLEFADPLVKVSIIPRGVAALGFAQYLPKEQYLYSTEQLVDRICMALGGRAAEELTFGRITTGAQSDLETITKMAYSMVAIYGMNKKIGNVSYYDPNTEYSFNKPYSEDTAKIIDEEVKKLIEECHQKTLQLLREKSNELEILAQELLKKEILYKVDLERLIGKRPYEPKHVYDEETLEVAPVVEGASPATPESASASQEQTPPPSQQQPVSETGVISLLHFCEQQKNLFRF
jgi:AFG3 family protein